MIKSCEFCDREVVTELPEKISIVQCGGKGCDHRVVYILENEDCKQVIFDDSFGHML